jgi:hypothetical protein
VQPPVLVVDEVGYLADSDDAANVVFDVVIEQHLERRLMIFTNPKSLKQWGRVLHDEDLGVPSSTASSSAGGSKESTARRSAADTSTRQTLRANLMHNDRQEVPEPTSVTKCCASSPHSTPMHTYERAVLQLKRSPSSPRQPTTDEGPL